MNKTLSTVCIAVALLAASPLARPQQTGGRSIDVDGTAVHYRDAGSGPTLLLLHGFTGTGAWWRPQIDDLAKRYRLIVPDLPGHGRSEGGPDPYRFDEVAATLHRLMDELEIDRFRAVGYSGGGIALQHMALQRPERIESMVVVSAPHVHAPAAIAAFPPYEEHPPEVRETWLTIHPGGETQVRRLIASFHALSKSVEAIDVPPEELGEIRARTLVVVGDRDPWFSLERAREMVAALPESALWVIPMTGHTAIWPDWGGSAEAAAIFPDVVTRFLGLDEPESAPESHEASNR